LSNPDGVKKLFTELVADKAANAMARKGTVTSLVLGATKLELLAQSNGYQEKSNNDKLVLKAIEQ
jgi:hypothetical protein